MRRLGMPNRMPTMAAIRPPSRIDGSTGSGGIEISVPNQSSGRCTPVPNL